ncbi:hypothetical protein PilKf_02493 [Pillotina sp. SPG140]|jgi:Ca-activated chloride channel family protein
MTPDSITFDRPHVLWFLLAVIPASIFTLVQYYTRFYKLRSFIPTVSHLTVLHVRALVSKALFGLTFVCLVIALAGPRFGTELVNEYRRGLDIIYAFDISRSMEVSDIGTTRLARAVQISSKMVLSFEGTRMGVVIGKGRGILTVPLSYDTETLLNFFAVLSPQNITGSSTDLESLVDTARTAFQNIFQTRQVIVLFSDGESFKGSFADACERAAQDGIILIAVMLGSETGGPVPDMDHVISIPDKQALENGAAITGGLCIDGNQASALTTLNTYLNALQTEALNTLQHIQARPRWQLWTIIAISALVLSELITKRRRT